MGVREDKSRDPCLVVEGLKSTARRFLVSWKENPNSNPPTRRLRKFFRTPSKTGFLTISGKLLEAGINTAARGINTPISSGPSSMALFIFP